MMTARRRGFTRHIVKRYAPRLAPFVRKYSRFSLSDSILRALWPFVVMLFRALSKHRASSTRPKKSITIVQGNPHTKLGPNLDDLAIMWVEEVWPNVPKARLGSKNLSDELQSDSLVLVCYSWLQDCGNFSLISRLLEVLRLAHILNRKNCSVLFPLPDTFRVANSFGIGVLVSLSQGSILLLQNSEVAARKYGLENIVSPVFWTWSETSLAAWKNSEPLIHRRKIAAFAASGDPRRTEISRYMADPIQRMGYEIWHTGSSASFDVYRKEAREVPIVITTCWLQPDFIRGPIWYRKRLSQDTLTGRVWEAFAAKSLLVCNQNSELAELGFFPDEHYIDLPTADSAEHWQLPSDSEIQAIATRAHEQFLGLRSRSLRTLRHLVEAPPSVLRA